MRIDANALAGINPLQPKGQTPTVAPDKDGDFAKTLMDVLKEVNDSQNSSRAAQTNLMTGQQSVDYHDLMIAMERAGIAMNLTIAVRNKILEAYQEISRMQI